jgi:hypothetical protein
MKIEGPNPLRRNEPVKKKDGAGKASSTDFFSLLSTEAAASAAAIMPTPDVQPSTSLDALLTLQEMPDNEVRDRQAFRQSQETIFTLERLRDALLSGDGTIPAHLLSDLQNNVRSQQALVNDPRLKSIMQDIELRAAVEAAKLERSKS